jgi:hypothetical protein
MLIAMMGNTYGIVIESAEKEFLKAWAKVSFQCCIVYTRIMVRRESSSLKNLKGKNTKFGDCKQLPIHALI